MDTAIFIRDKYANGGDYLNYNGKRLMWRSDILSAVAFSKGRHIYSSEGLNVYAHWNRIYIKTSLSDYSLDIKNRLVPVFFMTKVWNPVNAHYNFKVCLDNYGDTVNFNVLDELEKVLKKERWRRIGVAIMCALTVCWFYML